MTPSASRIPTQDQYRGALMGLALGDALGAPREGGPLERLLWRWLGFTPGGLHRFTDDTQMSVDLALSLIRHGGVDQDDLAARFAESYRWDRGYGPGAAKVLKQIRAGRAWQDACLSAYPAGSFGNGGAMRSPVIGLFFHSRPDELLRAAPLASQVTHAHPLAVEGATLVAGATAAALDGPDGSQLLEQASRFCTSPAFSTRLDKARHWLQTGQPISPQVLRSELGMGITATTSCVTSLYLAARFLDCSIDALIGFASEAGGDVDTVCAMAGALWGARNGFAALPGHLVARVEGAARLADIGDQLHAKAHAAAAEALR